MYADSIQILLPQMRLQDKKGKGAGLILDTSGASLPRLIYFLAK